MKGRRWIALLTLLGGGFGTNAIVRARTPEPLPAYSDARSLREDATLRAVAFGTDSLGVACGDRGAILRSEDGGQSWTHQESGVDCTLHDLIWIDGQRVLIVGGNHDRITRISRGVVLLSDDAGKHWRRAADQELPRLTMVGSDGRGSLVARGDWSHSQLGRVFESHDGGENWQSDDPLKSHDGPRPAPTAAELHQWSDATGVASAIRDACRVGAAGMLCAVGDHGVILISPDGGRSWQTTRGERRRTAILFLATNPASVAWSLLGSEALESRHRVALLLTASAAAQTGEATSVDIARQVAVMLGGSGADLISSDRGGLAEEAQDWIAVHRPSVLVLDRSLPADVRDAFFHAATAAGVTRVITCASEGGSGTTLHRDALLPKTGVLASDLMLDASHYVAPHRATASSVSLNYVYDAHPVARRGETVMGGLSIQQGQKLAAQSQPATRRQLQITQARLNQSQRVSKLIRSSRTSQQFAQSLRVTLDQTAKEDRFRLAWSVLRQTASDSSSDLQAFHQQALEEFASRFPTTSAGRWAKLRDQVLRHSLEWRRLRSTLTEATTPENGSAAEVVAVSPFQVSPGGVRQASAIAPILVPQAEVHELTQGNKEVTAEVDLAWEFHPLMLIAQEASRRRGDDGGLQVAGKQSANLTRLADANLGPWSLLLQAGGPQVFVAHSASSRPRLDGVIDDPCWQSAFTSAGDPPPLRMAYDDDYVYVAIQCRADALKPDISTVSPASSPRDQDLTQVDRMLLRIDIDRDLSSSMQLQVTDTGRTHDSIDQNPGWQPTWYVDTRRDEDRLVFELAILRRDLVELPIQEGESWFVSAVPLRAGSEPSETVLPEPSQWRRVIFQR